MRIRCLLFETNRSFLMAGRIIENWACRQRFWYHLYQGGLSKGIGAASIEACHWLDGEG
jgi:hypothetical protein